MRRPLTKGCRVRFKRPTQALHQFIGWLDEDYDGGDSVTVRTSAGLVRCLRSDIFVLMDSPPLRSCASPPPDAQSL